MMLCAVLWLFNDDGTHSFYQSGSLEIVRSLWENRPTTVRIGCLDIAFGSSLLPADVGGCVLSEPTLFVTDTAILLLAKHALIAQYDSPLSRCGLRYRVLSWENTTPSAAQPSFRPQATIVHGTEARDWVSRFTSTYSEHADMLLKSRIFDDESYCKNEHQLPHKLRVFIGQHRFDTLYNKAMSYDEVRQIVPTWIRELEIPSKILTVRLHNVFQRQEVRTWHEVLELSEDKLKRWTNIGSKSVADLTQILVGLSTGEIPLQIESDLSERYQYPSMIVDSVASVGVPEESHAFQEAMDDAIATCLTMRSIKSKNIPLFREAIGYLAQKGSLQDVAIAHGVTRERVRQIVEKCAKALRAQEKFRRTFISRLTSVVQASDDPLRIDEIQHIDPWFDDTCSPSVLAFLISRVWSEHYQIHGKGREACLLPVARVKVDEFISELQDFLQELADTGVPVDELETKIQARYSNTPKLFIRYAIAQLQEKILIAENPADGRVYFVRFGKGLDDVIRSILEASAEPVTIDEIYLALRKLGYNYALNSVKGRAHLVGIRFAQSKYGIRRHLKMTEAEINEMIRHIEGVIETDTERQWHIDEVKAQLKGVFEFSWHKLSDQTIIYLCGESKRIETRGYLSLAWRNAHSIKPRIKIVDTVRQILLENGGPMCAQDLRDELSRRRGVSKNQQLFNSGPIIHLRNGLVGLVERDIPLTEEDYDQLFTALQDARDKHGINPESDAGIAIGTYVLSDYLNVLDELGIRGIINRNQHRLKS